MFQVVEKTARMIADAGRKIKQRFAGIAKFVFCVVLFYGLNDPPIAFSMTFGGIFTHKVHSRKLNDFITPDFARPFAEHSATICFPHYASFNHSLRCGRRAQCLSRAGAGARSFVALARSARLPLVARRLSRRIKITITHPRKAYLPRIIAHQ